jgi:transposase InsO family protein
LHQLNKENMVTGLTQIKFSNAICQDCILGKNPEQKIDKGKEWRESSPLQMIHSDVMGPFPNPSISKYWFVLSFIDDYSHFTWVYFLTLKSQVFQYFKEFKALIENQSKGSIKIIHSDNGGDYFKKYMQQLCS